MSNKPDYILDASGLYCPEPVMLLHNQIRDMAVGETVQVMATDPSTQRDIPRFCTFLGHDLLQQDSSDGNFIYLLRKCEDK